MDKITQWENTNTASLLPWHHCCHTQRSLKQIRKHGKLSGIPPWVLPITASKAWCKARTKWKPLWLISWDLPAAGALSVCQSKHHWQLPRYRGEGGREGLGTSERVGGKEKNRVRWTVNELESMRSIMKKKCFLQIMEEVCRGNKWRRRVWGHWRWSRRAQGGVSYTWWKEFLLSLPGCTWAFFKLTQAEPCYSHTHIS